MPGSFVFRKITLVFVQVDFFSSTSEHGHLPLLSFYLLKEMRILSFVSIVGPLVEQLDISANFPSTLRISLFQHADTLVGV